jgi:hypothetical protein
VSESRPLFVVGAEPDGEGVLIDGAAHSHVSARRILHNGGSSHRCYSEETTGEVGSRDRAFRSAAECGG